MNLINRFLKFLKGHEHTFGGEEIYVHGMPFLKCTYPGCSCMDHPKWYEDAEKAKDDELTRKVNDLLQRHKQAQIRSQETLNSLRK